MDLDSVHDWDALHLAVPALLRGWMCVPEYARLIELARQMRRGQRVVEIGTYGGTTVAIFALFSEPGVEIHAIDDFSNDTEPDLRRFFEDHQAAVGTRERITLHPYSSHRIGPSWNLPISLLIIDGDHEYAGAYADLRDYSPWVVPGGLMIVDDYTSNEQVRRATDDWFRAARNVALWDRGSMYEMPDGKMIEFKKG